MAEDARSLTGKSLSIYARRARIAAVVAFFRDAIAWGWSVPVAVAGPVGISPASSRDRLREAISRESR